MSTNEQTDKTISEKMTQDNSISTEQNGHKEDGDPELNKTFNEIIIHFSDFLSKHSVYEAAPENSKVLVFNSDLSFKEMVKAFINEDIYCALIYDSEKEYFVGLITISDILLLFKYIIEKSQKKEISDYELFIKDIFSPNFKNQLNLKNPKHFQATTTLLSSPPAKPNYAYVHLHKTNQMPKATTQTTSYVPPRARKPPASEAHSQQLQPARASFFGDRPL